MRLDDAELLLVERSRLVEDVTGDPDLPDVMEQRTVLEKT
jgi:hypothetical protein